MVIPTHIAEKGSAPSFCEREETRRFYTETLLHTEAFTHRHFYTQTPHKDVYTQKLSHTETPLHTNTSTYKNRTREIAIFPQFLTSNVHFVRKGCARRIKVAIFPSVFDVQRPFRAKGLPRWTSFKIAILPQVLEVQTSISCERVAAGQVKSQFLVQFLTSNVHFVRKGCTRHLKLAIFPQFLTSNVHFVRKKSRWTG